MQKKAAPHQSFAIGERSVELESGVRLDQVEMAADLSMKIKNTL